MSSLEYSSAMSLLSFLLEWVRSQSGDNTFIALENQQKYFDYKQIRQYELYGGIVNYTLINLNHTCLTQEEEMMPLTKSEKKNTH